MPHDRFFIDHLLQPGMTVTLIDEEAHHLQKVMRKKWGDYVELVNGRNQIAEAQVEAIQKKGIVLMVHKVGAKTPPPFPLIICQALPRINRLDVIIEKGTELGMNALWLFPGMRSEKKELTDSQWRRLKALSISSMKQCGRLDLPEIVLKPPLLTWSLQNFPGYYGDLSENAPTLFSVYPKNTAALFFIGPESGFTQQEEAHLKKLNIKGVKLHPNILRTDTAPLAVLSILSAVNL
jgi:16S rRNA (uracil1498-N3)-methyltransferase